MKPIQLFRWAKSRSLGNALAVVSAILVVALLSFLIFESRSVTTDYYVSHAQRTRALEATQSDMSTAIAGMREAFATGTAVPATIETNFLRLRDNKLVLQDLDYLPRRSAEIQRSLDQLDKGMDRWLDNSAAFITRQNALAETLASLQAESPTLVRELRQRGLSTQSRGAFSLALDTMEYATGQSNADAAELRRRITELREDSALRESAPESAAVFLDEIELVVGGRRVGNLMLALIENGAVTRDVPQLASELSALNQETVSRAESARVLLSVCTILLLLGVAYVIYRLQSSYRALNDSNMALQQSNETLEQRVTERTEKLEAAYGDLKDSQAQLIHAEKMSSLGEMIAGVSHEINTPLWYLMSNSTVIQERLETVEELCKTTRDVVNAALAGSKNIDGMRRGLSDLHKMMEAGIEDDIDEARQLIEDSIAGLDELATLAQGLKDFSRRDRAQHGPFNVNEGLDKSLIIIKNRLKDRIKIHKYYADVPLIHCSPSQINQIFLNLLSNAADAIEGQGDIVLQTRTDGGNVIVTIGDTGPGIPADVLPRIRDPFFTTKEVGQGTGLGLSIVDRIVADHNGELHVDSMPGRGTSISVTLPVDQRQQVSTPPEQPAADFPEMPTIDPAFSLQGNHQFLGDPSQQGERPN